MTFITLLSIPASTGLLALFAPMFPAFVAIAVMVLIGAWLVIRS